MLGPISAPENNHECFSARPPGATLNPPGKAPGAQEPTGGLQEAILQPFGLDFGAPGLRFGAFLVFFDPSFQEFGLAPTKPYATLRAL